MRKLVLSALFVLVAGAANAATLTERVDRTFDVRPGAEVMLKNVNGRITVQAWDQPRVRVVALKEVEADKADVRRVMSELRVEFRPQNGGLSILTHYPKRDGHHDSIFDWILGTDIEAEVSYEVTVPRRMNVEVSNTNGSIVIAGVTGQHDLDTTNGRIEVSRCAGALEASTTNGSIRAELTEVAGNHPLRLETTNGRIEVAVPATLKAEINASTTNGSIHTDFPITTSKVGRNSLRGSINGGGMEMRLRTTNGGIAIRSLGKS